MQKIDNYSSTDVERTTIYFGKNAINQAYTLIGNFTDATMIMTAREDQLIDVVIGATFNDLQDTNSSPQSGKTITTANTAPLMEKTMVWRRRTYALRASRSST